MAVASSENTSFGVHEWNKIRSDTETNQIFCFFYVFILLGFYLDQKTNFFLAISRQFGLVQREKLKTQLMSPNRGERSSPKHSSTCKT